jgi:hypothetical protein
MSVGERLAIFLFPMAVGSALLYLVLALVMMGLALTRRAARWCRGLATLGLMAGVFGLTWGLMHASDTFAAFVAFAPIIMAIPMSVGGSTVALALLVGWFVAESHQTWGARHTVVKQAAAIGLLVGAVLGAIVELWFLQQVPSSLRQLR